MAPVSSNFRDSGQAAGSAAEAQRLGCQVSARDSQTRRWFVNCLPLGEILFTWWGNSFSSPWSSLSGTSHMCFINKNEKMESLLLHNCSSFARPNLSKAQVPGVGQGEKNKRGP